jgi:hypothetical protein
VRGGVGEEVVGRCGRGKSVCTAGGGEGKKGVIGEGGGRVDRTVGGGEVCGWL